MVIWAEPATTDLRIIHDFITSDSKYYAKKVVRDIVEKTSVLEKFPKIGRKVQEIDDENIREIFMYSYRILYEIKSGIVYVIGIIHGNRDFSSTELYRIKEPNMHL